MLRDVKLANSSDGTLVYTMSYVASDRLVEIEHKRMTLASLDEDSAEYATNFIDGLLASSRNRGVSDVHIQPIGDELEVRWRVDGVLQEVGRVAAGGTTNPITRLKVLAELLTYRQDVPQEGRIRDGFDSVEMRVTTFPTLDGEGAVLPLFAVDEMYFSRLLTALDRRRHSARLCGRLPRLGKIARFGLSRVQGAITSDAPWNPISVLFSIDTAMFLKHRARRSQRKP